MKPLRSIFVELTLITFLGLSLSFLWTGINPTNGTGPDETNHANVAEFIAKNRRIPKFNQEPELVQTKCQASLDPCYTSEAYHPPLSYFLYSLPRILTGNKSYGGSTVDFQEMRVLSIIFYTGYLIFLWLGLKAFSKLINKPGLKFPSFIIAGFLPSTVFLSGYINIDVYSLVAAALAFWMTTWAIQIINNQNQTSKSESGKHLKSNIRHQLADLRQPHLFDVGYWMFALLGLSYGLLAQAKPNYLFLLVILFSWLIINLIAKRKLLKRSIYLSLMFTIVILVAINFPWWYHNFQLYKDPLLNNTLTNILKSGPLEMTAKAQGYGLRSLATDPYFLQLIYRSFLGVLGPVTVYFPEIFYRLSGIILTILSVLSIFVMLFSKLKLKIRGNNYFKASIFQIKTDNNLLIFLSLSIIALLALHISITYRSLYSFQPQGRYYFSMLIPFGIFISYGITEILNRFSKYLNLLLSIIFLFINLLSLDLFTQYYFKIRIWDYLQKYPQTGWDLYNSTTLLIALIVFIITFSGMSAYKFVNNKH